MCSFEKNEDDFVIFSKNIYDLCNKRENFFKNILKKHAICDNIFL